MTDFYITKVACPNGESKTKMKTFSISPYFFIKLDILTMTALTIKHYLLHSWNFIYLYCFIIFLPSKATTTIVLVLFTFFLIQATSMTTNNSFSYLRFYFNNNALTF